MKRWGELEVSDISWELCAAAEGVTVTHGQLGSLYLSSQPALQREVLSQGSLALSLPLPPAQKSDVKCDNKRVSCQVPRLLYTDHAVHTEQD